ncbi:MAG: Uma2 family endonuclease [Trueperaceae bacterium]
MLKHHTFTTDDFALMAEAGVFADQKVELLDGLIYDMSPANPAHEYYIDELHERFVEVFGRRARVRSQNALDIGDSDWLPHPDVMLLKRRDYRKKRPTPQDALLVIEIANTSYDLDINKKAPKYAKAGIQDYWVINMKEQCWVVHREPSRGKYKSITNVSFDKPIAPLAFPKDAKVWLE